MFCQYGVKFTALKPHTIKPGSQNFKAEFDRICRVVGGVKGMGVGAIGYSCMDTPSMMNLRACG